MLLQDQRWDREHITVEVAYSGSMKNVSFEKVGLLLTSVTAVSVQSE